MMSKPSVYIASDYAGIVYKDVSFYFGYEVSVCAECGKMTDKGSEYCDIHPDSDRYWCFQAKFNGEVITIPSNKLGDSDMFDVTENLMLGIGWLFAKYHLELNRNEGEKK